MGSWEYENWGLLYHEALGKASVPPSGGLLPQTAPRRGSSWLRPTAAPPSGHGGPVAPDAAAAAEMRLNPAVVPATAGTRLRSQSSSTENAAGPQAD